MSDDCFPDTFHRGFPTPQCLDSNGYVTLEAFQFKKNEQRDIEYEELSVNWNDSEGAAQLLLKQLKKDSQEYQFKLGYCTIHMDEMNNVLRAFIKDSNFGFERFPIEEDLEQGIQANPFHGNLLVRQSMDKAAKRRIQAVLASLATNCITYRNA